MVVYDLPKVKARVRFPLPALKGQFMILTKEFTFCGAHKLKWHQGKCKNLHGHTYKMQVSVKGVPNKNGIIIDFADLDKIVKSIVIEKIDHSFLNEVIDNPTAENVAIWIWDKLAGKLKGLYLIKLWESKSSFVEYRGE